MMPKFKKMPTLDEGAKTWSYLTNMLTTELEKDVADDEDGLLASADISLESLSVPPVRDMISKKIDEALLYWEKLSQRIPLKREAGGSTCGRRSGSSQTYVDFDVSVTEIPSSPPPVTETIETYRYYLKRLMCSVPRAEKIRGLNTASNLRMHSVKQYLDTAARRKPYGDCHLLKESNYLPQSSKSKRAKVDPLAADRHHPNSDDDGTPPSTPRASGTPGHEQSGAGLVTSTTIDDGLPNAAGDITTGGGSGDKLANRSGGGTLVPAQDTSATPPADGAARCEEGSSIYSAFSAPCHLVVKFSFCRSAATGGNGPFPEKRLFDVEALGENTLQQVMEAIPPCLSDRVMDAQRKAGDGGGNDRANTATGHTRQSMTLGGAFLFTAGFFYLLRPAEGEDDPPPPMFPLPPGTIEDEREKCKQQQKQWDARVAKLFKGKKTKKAPQDPAPSRTYPEGQSNRATPESWPSAPPEPWIHRWLLKGGMNWNAYAQKLMSEAQELQTLRERAKRSEEQVAEMEAGLRAPAYLEPPSGPEPEEELEETKRSGQGRRRPRAVASETRGPGGGKAAASSPGRGRGNGKSTSNQNKGPIGKGKAKRKANGKELASSKRGKREASVDGEDGEAGSDTSEASDGRGDSSDGDSDWESDNELRGLPGASAAASTKVSSRKKGARAGSAAKTQKRRAGASAGKGKKRPRSVGAATTSAVEKKGPTEGVARQDTDPGQGGQGSEDEGPPRWNRGYHARAKLGFDDKFVGEVVWASDVTVAQFRPVLGQRYMFVHHCDCEHYLIVSDIRLDPISSSSSFALPIPAKFASSGDKRRIPSAACSPSELGRPEHDEGLEMEEAAGPSKAAACGSDGAAGSCQEVSNVAQRGSTSAESAGRRRAARELRDGRQGFGDAYPKLCFRTKPNVKRCAICTARVAVYKSFGHPLADEVPVYFCQLCFGMLHYDADGKCLAGEAAGVKPVHPENGMTEGDGAVAMGTDNNLANWRVFQCFDEL